MKTLTIVIPLYNEEKRLAKTFEHLLKFPCPKSILVEKVVFVNDGSKDQTLKLLKSFQSSFSGKILGKAKVQVVSYPINKGRGYAVIQGMKDVESDYGLFLDGDMSIPLDNLKTFSKYMSLGYDVLLGSKKLKQTITLVKRSWLREFIGEVHSLLLSFILGIKLADFTGGFKMFSLQACKDVFPKLTQERWGLDPEVIYVSHKLGYKMIELPIVWSHISTSSKVNLVRDILRAFKEMLNIRLNDLKNVYGIRPVFKPSVVLREEILSFLLK